MLTNLRSGVDYMGCGKDHCAASYAKAMLGQRIGLSDVCATALQALTMEQFSERLKAERTRLASNRQTKAENEARWKREAQERAAQREAQAQAAELLVGELVAATVAECESHAADESDAEKDAAADRFIRAKDDVLRALRSASPA